MCVCVSEIPHWLIRKKMTRWAFHHHSKLVKKNLDSTKQGYSGICIWRNMYIYHPWNLTWIPKIAMFERKSMFQPNIFGIYVRFRGCMFLFYIPALNMSKTIKKETRSTPSFSPFCPRLQQRFGAFLQRTVCWKGWWWATQIIATSFRSWVSGKSQTISGKPRLVKLFGQTQWKNCDSRYVMKELSRRFFFLDIQSFLLTKNDAIWVTLLKRNWVESTTEILQGWNGWCCGVYSWSLNQ